MEVCAAASVFFMPFLYVNYAARNCSRLEARYWGVVLKLHIMLFYCDDGMNEWKHAPISLKYFFK